MGKRAGAKYGKLFLDLILLVLLALMYQKRVISMDFHETGGLVLFGLFLLHKALNWQWIRAVTAGIFRRRVKLSVRWLVDVLLLLAMTAVLITGLLISKTLPTAMVGAYWLKPWHFFFAALSLALSGIHLGLHAGLLRGALWGKLPLPGRARTAVGALLLCVVFCFGTYSLVRTNYLSWFSQPMVSFSASPEAGHAPAFEEGGHPEGKLPGGGSWEGKGPGGGKGLGKGLGKGQGQEGLHPVSPANVLQTAATYASILLWFAIVTAALETGVRRSREKKGHARSE